MDAVLTENWSHELDELCRKFGWRFTDIFQEEYETNPYVHSLMNALWHTKNELDKCARDEVERRQRSIDAKFYPERRYW